MTLATGVRLVTHVLYFIALAALLLVLAGGSALVFRRLWRRPSVARRLAQRCALMLGALLVTHGMLDLGALAFLNHSDGFGLTLASQRWSARHWHPINALGYRDREHSEAELNSRPLLAVVGDSFVAGNGIERVEDRFSDRLGAGLGDAYRMVNIAKGGWNTQEEFAGLEALPGPVPRVIVLSYFLNDIDGLGGKRMPRPALLRRPPALLRAYVAHSPLGNEVYWKLSRAIPRGTDTFRAYVDRCYADAQIWQLHSGHLLRFADYAKQHGVRLIVVLWPMLNDIAGTAKHTARVAALFESRQVEVLDLATVLGGRQAAELVVNASDAHPSVAVHREVAELLLQRLQK